MKVTRTFSFDDKKHQRILAWLDQQDNESAAVREAILCKIEQETGVTLADIYRELQALKQRGVAGQPPAEENAAAGRQSEADANIDKLLGL